MYSKAEIDVIKKLIEEGKASPNMITEYGYLLQEEEKANKTGEGVEVNE
ncbi:hypothetical protein [Clostridium tyrobutyricum]|nr:hypothetical protein [Clostridium tyrobutyricum]QCH27178.1 hypothetical protein EZN00_00772 [Clostridium tyrobutyricum]